MFSNLVQMILVLIIMALSMPILVNIFKNNLYNEWMSIWKNEIETEKRKLAMQGNNVNRKDTNRKQRL